MEGKFKGRFEAYSQNLQKDGTWGDELTLLGAAHLLRQPVLLATDSSDNEAFTAVTSILRTSLRDPYGALL